MIDDKDVEKLSEVFATKKDLENLVDIVATKAELTEFKNEVLAGQDKMLGMLTTLTQEKTIGDEQDKRQKKVLEIHNTAMKSKGVLSPDQALEIDKLRVF